MATCFSILTWKIPWTGEPSRLWSMGLQRVRLTEGLSMCARARAHTHTHTDTEDTCGPPKDCFQQCEDWSRAETVMPRARAEVVPKKERQEAHTWVLTLPFTGALIHSASVHVGC